MYTTINKSYRKVGEVALFAITISAIYKGFELFDNKISSYKIKAITSFEEYLSTLPIESKELHKMLSQAEANLKKGNLRYSLFEARIVLEYSLKRYLSFLNYKANNKTILENLETCHIHEIFDEQFLHKLHIARKTCNINSHQLFLDDIIKIEDVQYAINQIRELLIITDNMVKKGEK